MSGPENTPQGKPWPRWLLPRGVTFRQLLLVFFLLAVLGMVLGGVGSAVKLLPEGTRNFIGGVAVGLLLSSLFSAWVKPTHPTRPLSERVQDIARDPQRKIEAILAHRDETGADLAESVQAVESFMNRLPADRSGPQ